jgi:probable phosphoglycerate mutase
MEQAKSGRYTGTTDLELTSQGITRVSSMAEIIVGVRRLVNPSRLARVFVSSRKRARHTFEVLQPWVSSWIAEGRNAHAITYIEDIAERDYGG